jgi:hypothetical protein
MSPALTRWSFMPRFPCFFTWFIFLLATIMLFDLRYFVRIFQMESSELLLPTLPWRCYVAFASTSSPQRHFLRLFHFTPDSALRWFSLFSWPTDGTAIVVCVPAGEFSVYRSGVSSFLHNIENPFFLYPSNCFGICMIRN